MSVHKRTSAENPQKMKPRLQSHTVRCPGARLRAAHPQVAISSRSRTLRRRTAKRNEDKGKESGGQKGGRETHGKKQKGGERV
ncbi:hypothetical protein NDU88_002632 [Pleurodeles waltl]|uniref:Uncharacterized protein n=1 Tax=Pleurodeles waltl TaxID=8319 RepID=A0AAV7M316_PLEWA|nr:hypothetical protein NDU88_002632 [Pleurodeles waltl]